MTDFSRYGRPRRVDGGLRARSSRGAIGTSWWSRRFLAVLESFALGTRLTRGRSYARAGQVLSLDVTPGLVAASVQGSRPRPYRVRIRLRPYAEPVWARIEQQLAAQALYSARLLAGDLPPDLEQVFADAGAPLFPAAVSDLDLDCTCPDLAVPCKHLAAAFYLLAEAFDADPFQILHWRGRDRERLLARLRTLRAGGRGAAVTTGARPDDLARGSGRPAGGESRTPGANRAGGTAAAGAGLALADLPAVELVETVERFWLPPVPLPDRAPTLVTDADLLLRQLGPPAAGIGGPGLVGRLRRAYERFVPATRRSDSPADPGREPARAAGPRPTRLAGPGGPTGPGSGVGPPTATHRPRPVRPR